ncbi:hypothetical protein GGX14DRAFT_405057 [Mycena pura]|uniref:Uncharacterized protein n=1 Tax=Mycena pura TaxID=153505 RepID=A0AAD6Y6T1_9AGAR|nr:hypothetical protein GGX14DRAFT_405057 [Mycena pura]
MPEPKHALHGHGCLSVTLRGHRRAAAACMQEAPSAAPATRSPTLRTFHASALTQEQRRLSSATEQVATEGKADSQAMKSRRPSRVRRDAAEEIGCPVEQHAHKLRANESTARERVPWPVAGGTSSCASQGSCYLCISCRTTATASPRWSVAVHLHCASMSGDHDSMPAHGSGLSEGHPSVWVEQQRDDAHRASKDDVLDPIARRLACGVLVTVIYILVVKLSPQAHNKLLDVRGARAQQQRLAGRAHGARSDIRRAMPGWWVSRKTAAHAHGNVHGVTRELSLVLNGGEGDQQSGLEIGPQRRAATGAGPATCKVEWRKRTAQAPSGATSDVGNDNVRARTLPTNGLRTVGRSPSCILQLTKQLVEVQHTARAHHADSRTRGEACLQLERIAMRAAASG